MICSGTCPKPHSLVSRRRSGEKYASAGVRRLRTISKGFQHIAALADHAERQGTFEIPLLPQLHQIVSERAVLERDFIDLHSAEGRHEVAIQPGNLLRVAGRSGWRDDTFPSIAETSPGHRRKGGQAGPLSNLGELLGQQGATSKGYVLIAQKAGSKAKSRIP